MFDWITRFMEENGYLGIPLLMLGENLFPPIPSELIMPLAGFTAVRGDLNLVLVIMAGLVGSVAGTAVWYAVGLWLGMPRLKDLSRRHGRWMTLTPGELDRAQDFFLRHSRKAVFLGRPEPGLRTLISIPAGVVRMSAGRFLLYSSLGSLAWTSLLATVGYQLGAQYDVVAQWLNPISNVMVGSALLLYGYRVATSQSGDA